MLSSIGASILQVTSHDLATLQGTAWLNDEVPF